MHEASLMRNLMGKILEIAEAEGGRVSGIRVWLGALSHMSPAHFKEHYDEAAAGTLAEGAWLETEISEDIDHPQAGDILLKSVEVTT